MSDRSTICLYAGLLGLLLAAGCQPPARHHPDQTAISTPMAPEGGEQGVNQRGQGDDVVRPMRVSGADRDAGVVDPQSVPLADRDPAMTLAALEGATSQSALQSIFFGFDEFNIRSSEQPKLEVVADFLSSNPGAKVVAEGHTDWRGTENYNLNLGDRRANAVRNFLVQAFSVDPSRVEILSKGELEAVTGVGKQDAVAQEDRRVDIFVIN